MVCPLCASQRATKLYTLPEGHDTRRCDTCAFVFLWPRPTADYLNAYYNTAPVYDFTSDRSADYEEAVSDKVSLIGRFLAQFPRLLTDGQAVDFGAGNGTTVKALERLGFDALGIEISAQARAAAHGLFGVAMRDGNLDDVAENRLSFLSLFDVLEHLTEPKAFLELARTRLKDNAACVVGVPNYNSLERMWLGTRSKALIFPEHVNQFTTQTLRRTFEGAGFDVLYIGSPPPYGVAISFGWRRSVRARLGRNALSRLLIQALTYIKRYLVYPLPNLFVEKTGLFGQSLLIVATRSAI
ncbi:class I SAM-dependent methyltransferase [Asticcacaulis sp. 201]|uniref:class I SAM-dependent methyltransferase n=1 Tax=Asticcacaulis sp. 201 TaxID=3028787 RepID=UPI0029160D0F|nr:class I SAM-dependent methyltransferase [Asticcacaulis sp. 201]MDV6332526.1 class I SAM-dependent methyltransferase [Asticcacaulis sp. 201]